MEGTPRDPSVDQALKALADKVPGGAPCPICGTGEWLQPYDLHMPLIFRRNDPEPSAPGEEEPSVLLPMVLLVLVCRNCSFVRQHWIDTTLESEPDAT